MTFKGHLFDKCRLTSYDEYICQRDKDVELDIKLILYDV